MAVRVSVTKAEEAAIAEVVSNALALSTKSNLALAGLLEKVEAAKVKREEPRGMDWRGLRDILQSTLGDRLALPPAPTARWYQQHTERIRSVGLTEEHAREIAEYLVTWRRPTIAFEMVTGRLTDLLAAARRPREEARGSVGGEGWLRPPDRDGPGPLVFSSGEIWDE